MKFNKARRIATAILTAAALGVGLQAFTYVQVHSLAVGSDTYKFTNYNGITNIGVTTYTGANVATVTGYYDGGCLCYHVPLAILNYQSGWGPGDVTSVKVLHLSPNLPRGQESTIEILDLRKQAAREKAPTFGARPLQLLKGLFVGIFDGKRVVGGGGTTTGK